MRPEAFEAPEGFDVLRALGYDLIGVTVTASTPPEGFVDLSNSGFLVILGMCCDPEGATIDLPNVLATFQAEGGSSPAAKFVTNRPRRPAQHTPAQDAGHLLVGTPTSPLLTERRPGETDALSTGPASRPPSVQVPRQAGREDAGVLRRAV